ncbi:hypothetical protein GCM10027059_34530 [Myceligenerans halotolerans]
MKSQKSWDVVADGRRLQVKCEVRAEGRRPGQFSLFRSWDFEACVFVILDARTYDVVSAVEVPVEQVQRVASWTQHVNGWQHRGASNLFSGRVGRGGCLRHTVRSTDGHTTHRTEWPVSAVGALLPATE